MDNLEFLIRVEMLLKELRRQRIVIATLKEMLKVSTMEELSFLKEIHISLIEGDNTARSWALAEIKKRIEALGLNVRCKRVDNIKEEEWENCPYCNNAGEIWHGIGSDSEPDECEFCHTNPNSVFYQTNRLWE